MHILVCRRVEVEVRFKIPTCYSGIPVKLINATEGQNGTLYADAITKVLMRQGEEVACSQELPQMYQLDNSLWYQ